MFQLKVCNFYLTIFIKHNFFVSIEVNIQKYHRQLSADNNLRPFRTKQELIHYLQFDHYFDRKIWRPIPVDVILRKCVTSFCPILS